MAGFTQNDSSNTYKVGQVSSGGDLAMQAGQDIKLSGTQVSAGAAGTGVLTAGRDVTIAAVVNEVKTSQQNDPGSKQYEKVVQEHQTVVGATVAAGGNLAIKAGEAGLGALAIAGSSVAGGAAVQLGASGDVRITQVQESHVSDLAHHGESSSTFKKSSDTTADYSSVNKVVGSSVSGDAVTVKSGADIAVSGSQLTATKALTLDAGRDLLVASAEQTGSEKHSAEHKKSGFSLDVSGGIGYSKSQNNTAGNADTVTQVGSVLSGGSVNATSGRDTTITGSTVVADNDISIDAKRNLSIVSAENSSDSASSSSSKKSGSIGTAFQPAIGTVKNTSDGTQNSVTQAGSQIASLGGNVKLKAGEQYTQTASEVAAPKGDISIAAKDVLINAALDVNNSTDHTTYSKTAIGGTISSPILDAAKSVGSMASAAKNTSDSRMQALAALNAAGTLSSMPTSMTDVTNAGLRVSVSLGNSKSESNVVSKSETVVGSTVAAGGNVSITATGAGKDSNLTAVGSDITAGGNVALSADNDVSLLAAKGTASQHSTNKSSGASVGIGFGIGGASNGFTIDLAVSQARGKADGDDIGYTNTHVNAGSNVTVTSGGDTTLKGGVIAADKVVANIGGDLNIESLQDSSKFDSKQSSSGLNASLCIPPFCYGASTVGGSISKSKVNGDFLSVLEQSGIKSGDGGFQVTVGGNTDLKGGLLSSNQSAVDEGKNALITGSLTSSDLQNKDEYSASGFSLSGSVSGKLGDQSSPPSKVTDKWSDEQKKAAAADGKPGASGGFGSASGSQGSTTASGISGGVVVITDQGKQLATGKDAATALAVVDRDVTTESAEAKAGALTKGWDGQQLQKEVDAQVAITQEFSKQAPKAIAKFADEQVTQLKEAKASKEEIAKWEEGGIYRTALHTVSGALTGGVGGALGAGAVASAAPLLNELQAKTIAALIDQGVSAETAKMLAQGVSQAAALSIGTAGGPAGAGSALATDTNNRQLHVNEIAIIEKLAKDQAKELCRGNADCEAKASIMWSDALERTARGLIDSKEAAKNAAYLKELVIASSDPNSEGARGKLAGYLDMLRTAQSLLTPYSGKAITINGKLVSNSDGLQTYFSATQQQQDDPTINLLAGNKQDRLLPGQPGRDSDRIDAFEAQNGSATPMYVAEDLLVGGAVANRVAGTLGRFFSSLDVGLAGTAGTSLTGNISAKQITEEGVALRLSTVEQSMVGQLNGLADTNVAGAVREFAADSYFMRNGFTRLEGKCGSNCFDGVYVKGDLVYINEVKPLNANGSIKLSGPTETLPTQMTDAWVNSAIRRLRESNTTDALRTADVIEAANVNQKLVKLVTGVNDKGITVVKLKGGK